MNMNEKIRNSYNRKNQNTHSLHNRVFGTKYSEYEKGKIEGYQEATRQAISHIEATDKLEQLEQLEEATNERDI